MSRFEEGVIYQRFDNVSRIEEGVIYQRFDNLS